MRHSLGYLRWLDRRLRAEFISKYGHPVLTHEPIVGEELPMIMERVQAFGAIFMAVMLLCRPGEAETLTDALTAAYMSNPTLAAQRARLRTADEQVPQALSGWRPTVQTFGDAGFRRIERNGKATGGSLLTEKNEDLFHRRIGGSIDQPIFRGGRTIAATRGAKNTIQAERARLWSVEQSTLLAATSAYVDVYRDQAVLDLTIRNEQRLGRQMEATQDRFRVGEVTKTDVFQAEARLARATADRIEAEGNLVSSRATYRNVVGEMPGNLLAPPLPAPLPLDREASVEAALSGNPDILAAQYNERAAWDNVDEVRGELLPSASLVGTAEREWEATRNGARFDTFEALARVSIPLYQAGAVYSRLRAAKQAAAEQRKLLDQSRRDAEESATQAWNNLETARAAINSFRAEVQANEVALEGVEREAEVGARTVLDILDAEQELLDSRVSLVTSQRDEIVAAFELVSATGDLTAENLRLPVEYYDPEEHYHQVNGKWFGGSSVGDIGSDPGRP